MQAYISRTVTNLVELLVFMGLILHILPGEQYQKYIKLLLGIVVIAFVLDAGGAVTGLVGDCKDDITECYNQKLNFEINAAEKMGESQYSWALSTYENKIKSVLNNYEFNEKIVVKDVEINVCEDVDSVDYGKITKVKVMLSKNVDKSGNILVSPIIIGKIDEKSDDLKADGLRMGIAEAIGVKEEVVQIVFS